MAEQANVVEPLSEEVLASARAILCNLLDANGGSVSTIRFREELERAGIPEPRLLIAHLKYSSAENDGRPAFRHYGRSFCSDRVFQTLEKNVQNQSESDFVQESVVALDPEPIRPPNRAEEARLGKYVANALENIYASDFGPEREYVFDVHTTRKGGDFENVDLLAVHWRSERQVELVTVEVKLAFTPRLIQQANNYRRFADRVWIAALVDSPLIDSAAALREASPLLFEYTIDLGLGILACKLGVGRRYDVAPIHWPRRTQPDAVEHQAFLERFRDILEAAGVLEPARVGAFPKTH